jgi:hypothetical protein
VHVRRAACVIYLADRRAATTTLIVFVIGISMNDDKLLTKILNMLVDYGLYDEHKHYFVLFYDRCPEYTEML